jgi:hypothetical protein
MDEIELLRMIATHVPASDDLAKAKARSRFVAVIAQASLRADAVSGDPDVVGVVTCFERFS